MKKFEKLVKEIKDGVEYEMRESIAAGWNHLSYEHDFGNTTVMVEVELVGCGLVVQINDVWVERDNSEHQSPMVVKPSNRHSPAGLMFSVRSKPRTRCTSYKSSI